MAREYTNRLIGMVEDGLLSWEDVAMACLTWMSEDEVKEMYDYEGFDYEEDEEV